MHIYESYLSILAQIRGNRTWDSKKEEMMRATQYDILINEKGLQHSQTLGFYFFGI